MSAAEAVRPEDYNPFDPAHVDDHFATLAALRESVRVHQPMPGVYYVPRYDDIVEVCRRPEEFGQGGFEPLEADNRPQSGSPGCRGDAAASQPSAGVVPPSPDRR